MKRADWGEHEMRDGRRKSENRFDGNEIYVKVCEYTDCSSLILKYQQKELHYKHSYSITPDKSMRGEK